MLRLLFIILFLTLACAPQKSQRTPPNETSPQDQSETSSNTPQPNITPTTQLPGNNNQTPSSPGINTKDSSGKTPLHKAAQFGNSAEVQNLISQGADVNAVDNFGHTPLHSAIIGNHLPIVQILVSAGANVNGGTVKPLLFAQSVSSNPAIIDYLRSQGAT